MIITPSQFDYTWFKKIKVQKRHSGNQSNKKGLKYIDLITAFDIETTTIDEVDQAVMYIWQWQFGLEYTVIGRTWEEFIEFRDKLCEILKDHTMIVFVHNLSFEFQFLRGTYKFEPEEVFAIDSRKILKCSMKNLEFRCSYLHSNMSLKKFTEKMHVEHSKLSGINFDYSKKRYSWTELSKDELNYCINDVLGLVEAITKEMELDGDNIYSYPITATSKVRREVKRAMKNCHHDYVKKQLPNYHTYLLLREAFRGGNTHANRYYAGEIIKDVKSADRSSSYPDVLCNCMFPVTKFFHYDEISMDEVLDLIYKYKKAVIMRIAIYDLDLLQKWWGCPYLSRDKCRNIQNGIFDNGRILKADYLETTITDIDLEIILSEYKFSSIIPFDVMSARYGFLPRPLVECIEKYYKDKTELKGIDEKEYEYGKSKALLNSIYGCMATCPVRQPLTFNEGCDDPFELGNEDPEDLLIKSNNRAFLSYAWGVWTTAHARLRLEEGIRLAGDGFIYCDTDSVKYIGDVDFTEYNKERIKDSIASGAYATDPKGITHYMGVFEDDGYYDKFSTLGAKKYCYEIDGKLHVTISGVSKANGGKELGKIENFKEGFIFTEAGGTESKYNDNIDEYPEIEVDGHKVLLTPNIVIKNSTYTLGITAEYERLLLTSKLSIDN